MATGTSRASSVPPLRVCRWELCHRFNLRRLYARWLRGEVRRIEKSFRVEPDGSRVGFYHYFSLGNSLIAMVHHHVPAGGAGPEDPKWLRTGRRRLVPAHDEHHVCPDCAYWRPLANRSRKLVR